jgi:hypothetical protein
LLIGIDLTPATSHLIQPSPKRERKRKWDLIDEGVPLGKIVDKRQEVGVSGFRERETIKSI